MEENKVPQDIWSTKPQVPDNTPEDIAKKAKRKYPYQGLSVSRETDRTEDGNKSERFAYIQGRIDERTAQTVVSYKTENSTVWEYNYDHLSAFPEDIQELAIAYAESMRAGDNTPQVRIDAARDYALGMLKKRQKHTVVSTDVEQMAKTEYPASKYTDVDPSSKPNSHGLLVDIQQYLRNAYIKGYNTAIQSQQKEIEHWKQVCKDLKEAMLFADRYSVVFDNVEDKDDLQYRKIDWKQMYEQSVQPTDSVREIAGLEQATKDWITKNSGIRSLLTPEFLRETFKAGAKWVYDSAARNLPVGNGWTDKDMEIAFESGFGYDEEAGSLKFKEWLEQYKLTHSLVDKK